MLQTEMPRKTIIACMFDTWHFNLCFLQPASARGIGIKVIHKWNQIPRRRPVIVQKYLSRPYLINDSKFDLRIYVYVTSYDPLRIYIYDDGLVRFASAKYVLLSVQ